MGGSGYQQEVEVVDFEFGGAESCVLAGRLPHHIDDGSALWINDRPAICGGLDHIIYGVTDKCYLLNMETGEWEEGPTMIDAR